MYNFIHRLNGHAYPTHKKLSSQLLQFIFLRLMVLNQTRSSNCNFNQILTIILKVITDMQ